MCSPKNQLIFALYAHSLISMNKLKLAADTIDPINNQGSMFLFCLWTGWLSAKYYNLIVCNLISIELVYHWGHWVKPELLS
jgi:hypothetical protein